MRKDLPQKFLHTNLIQVELSFISIKLYLHDDYLLLQTSSPSLIFNEHMLLSTSLILPQAIGDNSLTISQSFPSIIYYMQKEYFFTFKSVTIENRNIYLTSIFFTGTICTLTTVITLISLLITTINLGHPALVCGFHSTQLLLFHWISVLMSHLVHHQIIYWKPHFPWTTTGIVFITICICAFLCWKVFTYLHRCYSV